LKFLFPFSDNGWYAKYTTKNRYYDLANESFNFSEYARNHLYDPLILQ